MLKEVHKALVDSQVIPDVISDFTPTIALDISYKNRKVSLGNEISPSEAEHEPKVSFSPPNPDDLYTLVLADPDAPSREHPAKRCWRHWVVTDITHGDVKKGKVVTSYHPPTPPKGTHLHRYVFILFAQSKSLRHLKLPEDRGGWHVQEFADQYDLKPEGANFFVSQHE
ncbi:uncharacterized protein SPPG_07875 [Spizellomyces punctatus DAOM BR117]|uniref:YbhB/YbcL family Raf kinase inhibitor-like protein n=1 Tax=Spizellomyces punctatus (strain DAOM BR117) TaxID=645134 RepID=A0A0L0H7J8_SPIPD|nr:uncharacterized protein SPPG_07875 [Spizellomyces punctatus DAOM BR117]KNC96663.1 hypothetical protein SPPG_07875 [Spizellomyces punctatus DAOM BR117]|eukprot:XP_016604703.1 hypothetical protein SPPG_07875 [Spizellomyces punctatus DAOM BR117]